MLIRRMVSSFRGISSRDVKKSIREETALERSIWDFKNANSRGSFPGVKTSEKTEISI